MNPARSVCSLALLLALSAGVAAGEEAVLTGTGKNFEEIVKGADFVAVEFYASWCGHCKKLAPEWEKAAKELKKADPPVTLVKVEATEEENKELASKYGVGGFPTIKMFKGGNLEAPTDYSGPREASGIVAYLKARAGPAASEVTSAAQVEKLKEGEASVLGVFKGKKSKELTAFLTVAEAQRDSASFGYTTDASLAGKDVSAPGLVLFKQYDDPRVVFGGKVTEAAVTEWLDEKLAPLVPELDQKPRNAKAVSALFSKPSTKVVIMFPKDDSKDSAAFVEAATKSAQKDTKLKHLIIDSKSNPQALQFFGLSEKDLPCLVIQNKEDQKFIKQNAKPKNLAGFVAEFQAGKLKPTIKSEEAPKDNDGPVKVVTANTFDEIVRSGKDVLIEFYAPWCGHCKQLAPTYEEVGKAFKKNKTVTIAKMDATANDVPKGFEVRGFPTIAWVNGKDGSIVNYAGDRSKEDLKGFVERRGLPKPAEEEEDEEYGKDGASSTDDTKDHDEL